MIQTSELLCTQCGLCCDGSLFDDVALADTPEADRLEQLGLDIDTDDAPPLLLQPCAALCDKRCGIYAQRPDYCRAFDCRLLQGVQEGRISLEDAQGRIEETLQQVETVKTRCRTAGQDDENLPLKMRCIEVLALPIDAADDQAGENRSALARAMDTMGRLIHEYFLGD